MLGSVRANEGSWPSLHFTQVPTPLTAPVPSFRSAEIENHTGLAEKSLAEFIFSLSKGSKSVKDFQRQLLENGAEFQESLVHTLWNVIQRLQARPSASAMSCLVATAPPGGSACDAEARARAHLLMAQRGADAERAVCTAG